MTDSSSLHHHLAQPALAADMQAYQAIVGDLRDVAIPASERLIQAEFSQIAALLPFWLADLAPVSPAVSRLLGLAHLYGWWYYSVQDDLLDGAAEASALLGGHLGLLRMTEIYAQLGLSETPIWLEFRRLALASAAAYATELGGRVQALGDLSRERIAPLDTGVILDRAGPFFFNSLAQLRLAAVPADDPRSAAIPAVLRHFALARQLTDDASDWLADLKAGHVNVVAALFIRHLYDNKIIAGAGELDLERLAGLAIRCAWFWEDVAAQCADALAQAATLLAPFAPCRLSALIERQQERSAAYWSADQARRTTLRALFGLENI